MLFNSDSFLFEFLPAVLTGFFLVRQWFGGRAAQLWLAASSIAFYASSGLSLLPPLIASASVNFLVGRMLAQRAAAHRPVRTLLALGLAFDLSLLGYYKYAAFIAANLSALGVPVAAPNVILPLGISFYTFTQIAFLIDAARGEASEYDLPRYALFVTFFPHLIAGPIIHHKQMMPQLTPQSLARAMIEHFPRALFLFAIGLGKKVLLADGFARLASPIFDSAAQTPPDLVSAWGAMWCYTFQIYFDFSGYSDMALGLALLFGVELPVNFLSPYKSTSIIEFWRTWHITLSAFLRDYLYIPLGGNRFGPARRYLNLMLTMTIGGLWHGAGWTFVLWGALHGTYLLINHAWRGIVAPRGVSLPPLAGRALTFLCAALAWVLFRASTMATASSIYAGLLGRNGIRLAAEGLAIFGIRSDVHLFGATIHPYPFEQTTQWLLLLAPLAGLSICWGLPNSMEMSGFVQAAPSPWAERLRFALTPRFAVGSAALLFAAIATINSGAVSEFIYFRF